MDLDHLLGLARENLVALILAQAERIAALTSLVADLQARLVQPPKTPDNSSIPPSKAQKPDRAVQKALRQRRGRPGVARALHEDPDRVVEAHLDTCPHCEAGFPVASQTPHAVCDRIELPPLRPAPAPRPCAPT